MKTNIFDGFVSKKLEKTECKGKVYRYRQEHYLGKKGEIIFKEIMTPMKKLSCPGCESCGWWEDELSNELPPMPSKAEPGLLYYLAIENERRDWETGNIEGYDVVFREAK